MNAQTSGATRIRENCRDKGPSSDQRVYADYSSGRNFSWHYILLVTGFGQAKTGFSTRFTFRGR